jgi:hypothetical protein
MGRMSTGLRASRRCAANRGKGKGNPDLRIFRHKVRAI